jgi:hypothetical protein
MAHDDDYWRWRNAQDDQKWRVDRTREKSKRLDDAIIRGDEDIARWEAGVPPADAVSNDSDYADEADTPERAEPPTPDKLFREHRNDLLYNLRWAYDYLPQELLDDWTMRVERLDLQEAEAGLPAIEAIRDEYQRAANRYEPSITQVSRREEWDFHVPRIGHEIEWLIRLFRDVLTSR